MAIVAGIDNGTQSTKVLVYDSEKKEIIALSTSSHELKSLEDGTREQLASWWINALKDCFDQLDKDVRKSIQAIGVSGQQHGFVPVSEDGTVLYPVKLWCDTSTTEECRIITDALGGRERAIELTGNEIKPGYTASKVLWLKRNKPDIYAKIKWIMLPHDYLNFVLTDKASMEFGDASGTAFFNVRTRSWSKEVLRAIDSETDLSSKLPKLIKFNEIAGYVCKKASDLFDIPEGIPVSCGAGDNMASAIGTGTVSEGDLTMSMGTSGTLFGVSLEPTIDKSGTLASFCSSSGSYLPLLCTMNCTVSSELTRKLFDCAIKDLDKTASSAALGSDGVIMLPYFNGERTPNYPNGTGTIFGLNTTNMTKENILRSAMESSVFAMKYGLDVFKKLGFKPKQINLIGGGSKSEFWRQMVCDVTGLNVRVPFIAEAAAFGVALQALSVLCKQDLEEITGQHIVFKEEKSCVPDKENNIKYEQVYKKWLGYSDFMGALFK